MILRLGSLPSAIFNSHAASTSVMKGLSRLLRSGLILPKIAVFRSVAFRCSHLDESSLAIVCTAAAIKRTNHARESIVDIILENEVIDVKLRADRFVSLNVGQPPVQLTDPASSR